MKKLLYSFLMFLMLPFTIVAAGPSFQEELATQMKDDMNVIFVRNDTMQPLEIRTEQIGKHLLCFGESHRNYFLLKIDKEMFYAGQPTALVRCIKGHIIVSKGYV